MPTNKEIIKAELKELRQTGRFLLWEVAISKKKLTPEQVKQVENMEGFKEYKKKSIDHKSAYQKWFTKAYNVVKTLLPDRHQEFYILYKDEKRKNNEIDFLTYTISDYFLGLVITRGWEKAEVVNPFSAFSSKMEIQLTIIDSCYDLLDSKLADIQGILQYELFENELQAAKDLLNKKYNRAAGALAGVTLEIHLSKVCETHNIKFRKQHPTISDFNEELKKSDLIDVPTWRLIQRLGDIRNMSVHSKEREPTKDEIQDLIKGIEKLIGELN